MDEAKELARQSANAFEDGKWLYQAGLPIARALQAAEQRGAERERERTVLKVEQWAADLDLFEDKSRGMIVRQLAIAIRNTKD